MFDHRILNGAVILIGATLWAGAAFGLYAALVYIVENITL